MTGPIYVFGDLRLDCGRFELTRNGRVLALERKPLDLLILLVERNDQLVTRAEISERLWDPEVFVDTEHGINTAIRKIRQVLHDDPDQPHFVQTVTGKGYRFAAAVTVENPVAEQSNRPTPPATPVESAEEPTPPQEPHPKPTRSAHPPRRIVWALPILLVTALALALAVRAWSHHRETANIHSLAVLPLENVSGDATQEYFADGMTDELTTMLAKDSALRVVSRTSVMQYKRPLRPLSEIARALGVDGIVEGSVARSGTHVHMTLQLIRADTDSHLWAESYDRDANDAALAEDAARTIAKRLNSAAPTRVSAHYVNPAAHDAYLRGKYLWFTNMTDSGTYFRKATEIQPDYALAWAGLSMYYGEGIAGDVLDPRPNLAPMEEAADRALQLDPNLADAHHAKASAYLIGRWDWVNADREVLHAISLDPQNAELYYFRANILQAMSRYPESIESARKAAELNPFERPGSVASMYVNPRRFDEALTELQLQLHATPNKPELLSLEQDIARRKGNYKEAAETQAKLCTENGDPKSAADIRRAFEQGGARGYVRWQLNNSLKWSKSHYISPVELALEHAQLGDKDQTLTLLEEAYRQHSTDILWVQDDPAYDFLHDDPRYKAIIQKIGRPPSR